MVAWPDHAQAAHHYYPGARRRIGCISSATLEEGGAPSLRGFPDVARARVGQKPAGQSSRTWQATGKGRFWVATASPSGCARFQVTDLAWTPEWRHDFQNIPGTAPVWNTGGIILWQTGHFTDVRRQDVLVTIRRSMMHSEETALLSGKDGHELWRRNRQVSQRGVGGTPFAIADYDGDGLDDLASLHPSILYLLKGSIGRDITRQGHNVEGSPCQTSLLGTTYRRQFPGHQPAGTIHRRPSMTGLIRADGSLAWWDALDHGPRTGPPSATSPAGANSKPSAPATPMASVATTPRPARCFGICRCPYPGTVLGSASADLNGDGRDEALFVIGQNLVCLGAGSDSTEGRLLWQLALPAQTGPPSLAVLGRSGELSILLVGADGFRLRGALRPNRRWEAALQRIL